MFVIEPPHPNRPRGARHNQPSSDPELYMTYKRFPLSTRKLRFFHIYDIKTRQRTPPPTRACLNAIRKLRPAVAPPQVLPSLYTLLPDTPGRCLLGAAAVSTLELRTGVWPARVVTLGF